MGRFWLVVCAVGLAVGLALPAAARSGSGSIRVRITGLPDGATPTVLIVPPVGPARVLHASAAVNELPPGDYRIRVLPVSVGTSRQIPAGGTAYPEIPMLSVRVRRGTRTRVLAAYGTIESAAAKLLSAPPLRVVGDPDDPSAIQVARAAVSPVGTVLIARPSRRLPGGLFHTVVGVRGSRLLLRSAPVSAAYPSLYLDRALPVAPVRSAACGGLQVRIRARLLAQRLRASASGITGTLAGALEGTLGVSAVASSDGGCASDPATWRGFANVGGTVPIPYYVHRSFLIGWRSSGPFSFATRTALALSAGARFSGRRIAPTFSGWPQVSGRFSHDGETSVRGGFRLELGLGLPQARLAYIQVAPGAYGQSQPCSYAASTALAAGENVRGDSVSAQATQPLLGSPCPQHTLTVAGAGSGGGAISSAPIGIDCGPQCSARIDDGSHVALTATPDPGSTFAGWSGGGCSGTAACTVAMAANTAVTATFTEPTLTVTLAGTGAGQVTGEGLSCPGTCAHSYPSGKTVTLTATPAPGSVFSGWSVGGCSDAPTCSVIASSDATVTATFAPDASAAARDRLISLLEKVTDATGSSYQSLDSTGYPVGTIKIVASPAGGYLGVYHVDDNGRFEVRLGTSADLTHWTYVTTLDDAGSQPTIEPLPDGSFLVADEHGLAGASSHLRFFYYADLSSLESATASSTFDAPLTLSSSHEGTPNIRSLTLISGIGDSQIHVGFHYYDAGAGGDREATGTLTNFSTWSAQPNQDLNQAFDPVPANIGDRDFIQFDGYPFTVLEAQSTAGDWGSWRLYLYDETARTLTRLAVKTAGASPSMGNPAVTTLTDPSGQRALVASYFVFDTGSAPGEAGPLIFWTEY